MRTWAWVAVCGFVLIAYGVLNSYNFEPTPLWKIGSGLTTMFAPFALLGLLIKLYRWANSSDTTAHPKKKD